MLLNVQLLSHSMFVFDYGYLIESSKVKLKIYSVLNQGFLQDNNIMCITLGAILANLTKDWDYICFLCLFLFLTARISIQNLSVTSKYFTLEKNIIMHLINLYP